MGTTQRVLSGSKTRGSKARIVYPDEYSGSNTLDTQLEGVYVTTMDHLYGSTVVKIRPNNDFLKIIDGKVYKGGLRPFDDLESPSSFVFADSELTSSSPTTMGTNHPQYLLQRSQIALRDHGSGKDKENKGSGWKVAPNHFRDDRDLGQTDIFQDATAFFDTANMDPLNIVTVDPLTLDVPSNMVNQSDNNLMDGALEPFPLRSVIDRSNIEVPFQSRGIRADLVLTDPFRRSETITFESPLVSARIKSKDGKDFIQGTDPYLDGVEVFGLEYLNNRQKIIDAGTTLNYAPAVTGSKGDYFSGSINVQPDMWSLHKSLDLFMSTGSSTGPIALPGYLMQPHASITPFKDDTDLQIVTRLVKDEVIAAPGTYGDLNFNFTLKGTNYKRPPLTSSYGVSSRPRDLVYHARYDIDGNNGNEPKLRSQTGLQGTYSGQIKNYVMTGTYKTYTGRSADSPLTSDIAAFSLVPSIRSSSPDGFSAPGTVILDSCVSEDRSAPGGTDPRRYEPAIGLTIPGVLSASAPSAYSFDSTRKPAFASLNQINERTSGNTYHNTLVGNSLAKKMTKTDFPVKPFSAGVWLKGNLLDSIGSATTLYIHEAAQHLAYSSNPDHTSRYGSSGGALAGSNYQTRFYVYFNKEQEYGYIYIWLYNYDQHCLGSSDITAYAAGYKYFAPSSSPAVWKAVTDGNWHHFMYAVHGCAGKTLSLKYAQQIGVAIDAASSIPGDRTILNEEYANTGANHWKWFGTTDNTQSDSNWGSSTSFDPSKMPIAKVWVDGEEVDLFFYQYNVKNGSQSFRCPTVISDTLYTGSAGSYVDGTRPTNRETIHKFGGSPINTTGDNTAYHVTSFSEPHLFVTPIDHAHLSGTAVKSDGTAGGNTNNVADQEKWFNDNIWSGKVATSIYNIASIKSLGSVSGEILKNALEEMNVQRPGHSSLSKDHVSLGRGFVYDNTEYGFDSLVFGGLKK